MEDIFSITSSRRILKSEWKTEGTIPFIRVRDMVQLANREPLTNEFYVSEEFYNSRPENEKVKAGDIIISATSTIGKTYVIKPEERFYFKDADVLLFRKKQSINEDFFTYGLTMPTVWNQIEGGLGATTVAHFLISKACKIKQPLPPIELQEEFALLLKQSDKSKFIDFKSQFIEMFGDPEINSKGLPIATLPDLGENLDSKRIPITGGNRKSGEYPYYGASGIVDYVADYIFDDDLLLISEDGANLVARVTPIAFSSKGKAWINNHAHVIKFKSMAMQCYVESLLNMLDISQYVTGTAQPKLNQAKLNSIPIPVPDEEEIKKYLAFVEQSDKSK